MFRESSINLDIANFNLDGGTFVTVFSILDCVVLCKYHMNCVSFFYNDNKRSCVPSSLKYNTTPGLVLETGTNYYIMKNGFGMKCASAADCTYMNSGCSQGVCECAVGYSFQPSNNSCVIRFGMKCESTADCTYKNSDCSQGACQCAVGYSFQPSNNSCVTRCRKYGDNFSLNHHKGITEHNEKEHKVHEGGRDACVKSCCEETTFVCINVEFNPPTTTCLLGKVAWSEVQESDRVWNDVGWDLYIRNCEP